MRDHRFPNVLLADYVTRSDRGKHTVVNIFSGDVLVNELPANLRFGIYIEYVPQIKEDHVLDLDIQIDGKNIASIRGTVSDVILDNTIVIIQNFQIQLGRPLALDRPLTLSVRARVADTETAEILKKKILLGQQAVEAEMQADVY